MTAEEVKKRVLHEIGEKSTNRFGWEFRSRLLETPRLDSYDGSMLWTVLTEGSYHVVFDEADETFGIATQNGFVIAHGGLLQTLDSL